MYCCDPAAANMTVVVTRLAGRDGDLGRARAVDRLRAGPVALVDRGVADDPLVVDRVAVVDHERDRHAERHDHRARLVVRVVDLDRDRRRRHGRRARPRPPAMPASPARARRRRPGRAALVGGWHGPRVPACRSGHLDRRPASDQQQDAADAADAERQARAAAGPAASDATVPGRAGHVQAGHDPRRLRPPRSRRPRGRTRAAAPRHRSRTFVSQALDGTHSMPRSERRSSSSEAVAGGAVVERQAVVAGRDRQQGRRVVGQHEDVGIDPLLAGLAERRGSAAGPTGCRSGW